ncbi:MAG: hypothetical protein AAFY17_15480 [Cyanobacteria bacterium J06642_11]
MTLTIEITPELEHRLRQASEKVGLSPDTYVLQLLDQSLQSQAAQTFAGTQLSKDEAELLQTINHSLVDIEWQTYHALIAKRQTEMLTADEQEALIAFSDRLEEANVNRMQAIADLARLRHTSIDALMAELELKPLAPIQGITNPSIFSNDPQPEPGYPD